MNTVQVVETRVCNNPNCDVTVTPVRPTFYSFTKWFKSGFHRNDSLPQVWLWCEAGGAHPHVEQISYATWLFMWDWTTNRVGSRSHLRRCSAKVANCWKRCCWCVHKTFSWWGNCLVQRKSGAHFAYRLKIIQTRAAQANKAVHEFCGAEKGQTWCVGWYRFAKCGQLRRRLTCDLDTFWSANSGRFLVAWPS